MKNVKYKTTSSVSANPISVVDFRSKRSSVAKSTIPLNVPHLPARSEYNKYISKMYDNVWLTNNGPLVQEFSLRLADYLGVKNLLLTSNGTMALQVAYRALGLTDTVITSPFSFIATSSSLEWLNLKLSFADIDANSLNLCSVAAANLVNSATSALVPVHVYGNPCDVDAFEVLAKKQQLKVVYDAAHAFGIKYKGTSILNYGDASAISLHATKLFHSIEGGAVVINDDEAFERAKQMINFGISSTDGAITDSGVNGKMSEAHAAMGLAMLDEIDYVIEERLERYYLYKYMLRDSVDFVEWQLDATQNGAYFPIVLTNENQLLRVQAALDGNKIQSRRYFYPSLNTLPHLQGDTLYQCPHSEAIAKKVLCLPLFVSLGIADVKRICKVILKSL